MSIRMTSGLCWRARAKPRVASPALRKTRSARRPSSRPTRSRLAGLSSMYSTVRTLGAAGALAVATAASGPGAGSSREPRNSGGSERFNSNQNTLPTPTVLSTPITPPMSCTSSLLITSPMPVPSSGPCSWPSRLNGSNSCFKWPLEIPGPESRTLMRIRLGLIAVHSTATVPPGLLYLMALDNRLRSTCFKRNRSAWTKEGAAKAVQVNSRPRVRPWASTVDWQVARTSPRDTGSAERDSRPDSITARSRIWLISSSRYHPAWRICSMLSFWAGVGGGAAVSISWANPRMALSGVRSSWLMLERNSDLAWLALSATPMAVSSSWFFSFRAPSVAPSSVSLATRVRLARLSWPLVSSWRWSRCSVSLWTRFFSSCTEWRWNR